MELAEKIRQGVLRGDFQPGACIGSEHELGRQEKLARVTVRRASQILIDEGLIERRPGKGLFVRGPRSGLRTIQFVAGNLQWEPCLQIARGAQAMARQKGVQIQLYDAHGSTAEDIALLHRLPETEAAGAIVVSLHSTEFNEAVIRLKMRRFPLVLVDQRMQDVDIPSVTANNHAGGYAVGQALLSRGHRRIAFVGDLDASTVRDRLAGLRDALADAGLPLDRALVADIGADNRLGDWSGAIDQCTRQVLDLPAPPTAIAFSCDGVARPAYRTLLSRNLRIPQDISVVGFDDDPLAEWLSPPLATVRQPFREMGREAMEMLYRLMTDPAAPAERRVLPVAFVPRDSLSAAPSEKGTP